MRARVYIVLTDVVLIILTPIHEPHRITTPNVGQMVDVDV